LKNIIPITFIFLQIIFNFSYAQNILNEDITHSAKITFFKTKSGVINATIIPYNSSGSYPRSGWTTCNIISTDILKKISEKFKNTNNFEGYFIATYKKTQKDTSVPILSYKGELLKIKNWSPSFIKK
ncbi:MAG: hypothetical protein ACK4IX_15030, partial [Candidatus Sericytochromatia bacterium]